MIWPLAGLTLFAVPLSRNLFFFASDRWRFFRRLNTHVGKWELYLGFWRDLAVVAGAVWLRELWGIPLVFLVVYTRWWRWRGLKPVLAHLRKFPTIDPQEFFDHIYATQGFLPHFLPAKPSKTIDPRHLDFREGKRPQKSILRSIAIAHSTAMAAKLASRGFKWFKSQQAYPCASACALLWGSRLAQLSASEVIVEGMEKKSVLPQGRFIVAFNHKSFFDFAFAAFVLYRTDEEPLAWTLPRYLVAKDHFKDNPIFYRVLGMGQALEKCRMIFVERKKRKQGSAKQAVKDAARELLREPIPVAIYPQGTRAHGQLDRWGGRWDAGYFCVGNAERLKKEGSYFKKGLSQIALEAAASGRVVDIWPIAVEGTGTICPKGSLRVQTETTVRLRPGAPMRINPQDLPEWISTQVDETFQTLLNVAGRLEGVFLTDLREIVGAHAWEEVAVSLNAWRGKDSLLYMLLDCLYAMKPKNRRPFLNEIAGLLQDPHTPRERYLALKDKMAARIA